MIIEITFPFDPEILGQAGPILIIGRGDEFFWAVCEYFE